MPSVTETWIGGDGLAGVDLIFMRTLQSWILKRLSNEKEQAFQAEKYLTEMAHDAHHHFYKEMNCFDLDTENII